MGTSRGAGACGESDSDGDGDADADADAESDSDVGLCRTPRVARVRTVRSLPAAHWTARLAARMASTVEWSMKLLSVVDEAQADGAIARGLGATAPRWRRTGSLNRSTAYAARINAQRDASSNASRIVHGVVGLVAVDRGEQIVDADHQRAHLP
ncbi:hypothetical protein QZM46_19685 [Burkholderia vietnamiensis]|uniref:hypothetical protein n=1 Tax=Burkholderia vietnamiensis TaxID=60552 RepID=UPI00264E4ED2|nr:hypothetical protein [Burkholderia vietnamiensis]MDN7553546.1 hypothetical protein [Burkholderia vietnamiensis]